MRIKVSTLKKNLHFYSNTVFAQYDISATKYLFNSNSEQLEKIVRLIENGNVKKIIDKVFYFSEVKTALKYQKKLGTQGVKTLLFPNKLLPIEHIEWHPTFKKG